MSILEESLNVALASLMTGGRALDDCAVSAARGACWPGLGAALSRVLGAESPAVAFALCVGRMVSERPGAERLLRRAALRIAASVHALGHWDSPARLPFSDNRDETPRAVDWLLMAASGACADGAEDAGVALAVGGLCGRLHGDVAAPPPFLLPWDAPLLTYASAALVSIACQEDGASAAGEGLGRLVRIAEEFGALWCDRSSGLGIAEPHLLSHLALGAGVPEGELRLAWARAAAPIPEMAPIRALLARRPVLDAVTTSIEAWTREAERGLQGPPARGCVTELIAVCRRNLRRGFAAARVAAALPPPSEEEGDFAEPARTIRMAREALASDPAYHESVEVHRWGGWSSEPVVGRLFPIGLCLLARAATGENVSAEVDDLLARRRVDGWRYYEDWVGIWPDTDDLGLVLQLFPYASDRTSVQDALVRSVELLYRNTTSEGEIPVWLERDLSEMPPPSAPHWCRSHCMGVTLNMITGLIQARWPVSEGYLDRVLGYALARYQHDGDASSPYYPASYVRFQLARLWRSLGSTVHVDLSNRERLRTILKGSIPMVIRGQQTDGGWGSPMTTAFHLAMLEYAGAEAFDRSAAITYLSVRQEPDGLWPREPLYAIAGKDSGPYNFGSRSVTAAMCLYALATIRGARPW